MSNDHTEVMAKVFNEVLEQLAFMFADPPEMDHPDLDDDLAEASMTFHNAFSGAISLVVPRAMGPVLAANVLGIEPDDEAVLRAPYDALKELLTVTCGNVLTAIAGDEPVFDLTVPEIVERSRDEWEALQARENTLYCLVDEFPVLLHLEITGE